MNLVLGRYIAEYQREEKIRARLEGGVDRDTHMHQSSSTPTITLRMVDNIARLSIDTLLPLICGQILRGYLECPFHMDPVQSRDRRSSGCVGQSDI